MSGSEGSPFYDVAIVGAGSAGCVLAARLSEDPSRRYAEEEPTPIQPALLQAAVEAWHPPVEDPGPASAALPALRVLETSPARWVDPQAQVVGWSATAWGALATASGNGAQR